MYLASCATFTQWMLSAIHLASGQPCRATELEVLTWRNTDHRVRSVYVTRGKCFCCFLPLLVCLPPFFLTCLPFPLFSITGTLCLLQTYHKSRSLTGQERPIWRFLPRDLGRLVALFLSYVKPLETTLAALDEKEEEGEVTQHFLFVKFGARFTDENIRETVSTALSLGLKERFLFSGYR